MTSVLKKAILFIIALSFLLPVFAVTVKADTAVIEAPTALTVGEEFTVTLNYSSERMVYAYDFSLKFDSEKLSYISGADNIINSTLRFVNVSDGKKEITVSAVFTAVSDGKANFEFKGLRGGILPDSCTAQKQITVRSAKPQEQESENLPTKPQKSTASESREESESPQLSALSLGETPFTPDFSPDITEYSAQVEFDTKSIDIKVKAPPEISVTGDGEFLLNTGKNVREITLTAQKSEEVTVYTLSVYRRKQGETLAGSNNGVKKDDRNYLKVILTIIAVLLLFIAAIGLYAVKKIKHFSFLKKANKNFDEIKSDIDKK